MLSVVTASTSPTFGAIIRTRRLDLNMSQRELAEHLGVTQPTVTRWEADQSFPKPPELAPLAAILKIPLEDLLAPLEEDVKNPRLAQPIRQQLDEVSQRLETLEKGVEAILQLLRRRARPTK